MAPVKTCRGCSAAPAMMAFSLTDRAQTAQVLQFDIFIQLSPNLHLSRTFPARLGTWGCYVWHGLNNCE